MYVHTHEILSHNHGCDICKGSLTNAHAVWTRLKEFRLNDITSLVGEIEVILHPIDENLLWCDGWMVLLVGEPPSGRIF